MRAAAVIPAGGAGHRMVEGAGQGSSAEVRRKQYLELAGEPILLRAIQPFLSHPEVEWIVVALPAEDVESPPIAFPEGVLLVRGGADRGDSVRRALDRVPEETEVVLIHDGARPLVTRAIVDRTLRALASGDEAVEAAVDGVVAGIPLADTLKRVSDDGVISATMDRAGLWRAQTPQAFPRGVIVDAYRRAAEDGVAATDDAALVERYGGRVTMVLGDARNLKVTRPEDLVLAELFLKAETREDRP